MSRTRHRTRVSFVIQQGIEKDVAELLCALSERYSISCCSMLPTERSVVSALRARGIEVRLDRGFCGRIPEPRGGDRIEISLNSFLPALPVVSKGQVCVFTGLFFPSVLLAWLVCAAFRKPIILATTSAYGWEQHSHSGWLRRLKKRLLSLCSAAVVQGGHGERWARFYGVPSDGIFKPFKPVRRLFFETSCGGDGNTVLFVGRLVRQKGVATLISSLADGARDLSSARLCVVGDGVERGRLKRLVRGLSLAGRVSFLGRATDDRLASIYARSAVFVIPSEYELWGRVVGEAAACGLPIVTTSAVGCVGDLVVDGYNGFVVPPRNPKALAGAMMKLLKDPELRRKMGERSRKIAEKWSVERAAEALTNAIEYSLREAKKKRDE